MKRFFKNYRLPENIEILFMLIFGIMIQITDGSPFTIQQMWAIVWATELPAKYFSPLAQKCIKTVLSMIVVVRCVTTYAYVVFAMLAVFSVLRDSWPKLLLPWLLVAGVKSVCMTFLEALTGVYVCSAFGKIRKPCIEFFVAKALELIFAAYLWGSVLNIYQDMERRLEGSENPEPWEQIFIRKMNFRRQRARSLVDESTLYKTACLNYFEFKDVPQIILQMLRREDEMSQDSLLGPGMMLASVSNLGSFDHLKTSQSLGELGFVDLRSTQVIGLEEEENLSPQEKALRFLKLTWSDVRVARWNKENVDSDIPSVDQGTWDRLAVEGARVKKPKKTRPEVFWRDIPQSQSSDENVLWKKIRKNPFDVKFGVSFFNILQVKDSEENALERKNVKHAKRKKALHEEEKEEEEEGFGNYEEGDEDNPPYFMSNIREEVLVNRIHLDLVSRRMKGSAYAKLYRQDYMSVIGPEVFERATKLPKVTSLTRMPHSLEPRPSASLPAYSVASRSQRRLTFEDERRQKDLPASGSNLVCLRGEDSEEYLSFHHLEAEGSEDSDAPFLDARSHSEEEGSPPDASRPKPGLRDRIRFANCLPWIGSSERNDVGGDRSAPCCRKRRIRIKRIGKPAKINAAEDLPTDADNFPDDLDGCVNLPPPRGGSRPPFDWGNDGSSCRDSKSGHSSENLGCDDKGWEAQTKEIHFLMELLQKPLVEVLVTYYDLRNKVHVRRSHKRLKMRLRNHPYRSHRLNKYESLLEPPDADRKESKVWKSKVLKAADTFFGHRSKPNHCDSFSVLRRESAARKLLKTVSSFLRRGRGRGSEEETLKRKRGGERQSEQGVLGLEVEDHFIPLLVLDAEDSEWIANDGQNSSVILTQDLTDSDLSAPKKPDFEDAPETSNSANGVCGNLVEDSRRLPPETSPKTECIDVICKKMSKIKMNEDEPFTSSNLEILKSETDIHQRDPLGGGSPSGQESEEPVSLYYSKAADLASPLLDMKRFIYPDHIHYSYKHVKKKGFDVDLNRGLPLLVRESLAVNTPMNPKKMPVSKNSRFAITRRPMDLSFASTNAFAEWQHNDHSTRPSTAKASPPPTPPRRFSTATEGKFSDSETESNEAFPPTSSRSHCPKFEDIKHLYSSKDHALIKKLLQMHRRQAKKSSEDNGEESEMLPVKISSTQLHSNKGRINAACGPAAFPQRSKTGCEKETRGKPTENMF